MWKPGKRRGEVVVEAVGEEVAHPGHVDVAPEGDLAPEVGQPAARPEEGAAATEPLVHHPRQGLHPAPPPSPLLHHLQRLQQARLEGKERGKKLTRLMVVVCML